MHRYTLSIGLSLLALSSFCQTSLPNDSIPANQIVIPRGQLILQEPIAIADLVAEFTSENERAQLIHGYRVQIFNGSKNEAQKIRVAFLKAHPGIPVVMTYETPEYKIQAGNFRTRIEAEGLLSSIRATFKGSFVVKAIIDYPELLE